MSQALFRSFTLLASVSWIVAAASGQGAIQGFEVLSVTPSRLIEHGIDLKSTIDAERGEVMLSGPEMFSHTVRQDTADADPKAYLNWFAISKTENETKRGFTFRDAITGNDEMRVTIGRPAYLLSPAQRITTGPPTSVPNSLNYFKAYEVIDGPMMNRKVKLVGGFGGEDRTALKPRYICVPVEQWHHDEHFPIKQRDDCLVVYELDPQTHSAKVATIDQFGLNRLEIDESKFIALPTSTGP